MTRRLDITEDQWMTTVGDMLDLYRWRWFHPRPLRRASGKWETALSGNAGFVDIVALRPPEAHFLELKSETGRVAPAQQAWHRDLAACGLSVHVIRLPQDLDFLKGLLAPNPARQTLTSTSTSFDWRT